MKWIDYDTCLYIHNTVVERFGGLPGIRDEGGAHNGINSPIAHYNYEGTDDVPTLAAIVLCRVAKNHPFADGNKRTAFACALVFLRMNGYVLDVCTNHEVNIVEGLASGAFDEADMISYFRRHASVQ